MNVQAVVTGSRCLPHQAAAIAVCARCGSFMCDACADPTNRSICAACAERTLDTKALAFNYRAVVLLVGVQMIASAVSRSMPGPLALLLSLVLLGTIFALPVFAYRTARALGSDIAWLWAILVFVPCVNLVALLVLSSLATAACRKRGIPVGLLGPKV